MKHYTFSLLTRLVTAFILHSYFNAQAQPYSMYENCNEYYDSHGFYHKTYDDNKFDKRKMRISLAEASTGIKRERIKLCKS